MVSIIVPCYNEEETVEKFYEEFNSKTKELQSLTDVELIFVDDGSRDKTLEKIKKVQNMTESGSITVRYISFSRNFGKESAMYAGLKESKGDYCAVMDVDLQDPPDLLLEMYQELSNPATTYDCVATKRQTREGEPKLRSLLSEMFYKIINRHSETEIVNGARDYRLMRRKMVDAVCSLSERSRFSKGLFSWVGFTTKWISYNNIERVAGTTKWNFWKLFKYALEGFSSFTAIVLKLPLFGVVFGFLGLTAVIILSCTKVIADINTALILGVMAFILSFVSLCFWIVSFYIEKIMKELRHRPIYIVKERG